MEDKVIGQRVIWKKYFLLLIFVSLLCVDIWEFYSISKAKSVDTFLYVIAFVILTLCILIAVFTILCFIKKKDAIIVKDKKVIVREYKEKEIDFTDIKEINYRLESKGRYQSATKTGEIRFILNSGEKIKVTDLMNVKETCNVLNNLVFESKEN